jgi:hypothetical protein
MLVEHPDLLAGAAARPARPAADPADADAVAGALLDHLGRRLRVRGLAYADPPSPVHEGWESYIYTFRLRGHGLPLLWDRPLLLRIHANEHGVKRARHEFRVPRRLHELGYPVPEPVFLEDRSSLAAPS